MTGTPPSSGSTSASRDDSTLIQIDTLADWERLQGNFTDAIESALDAQLGPTASGAVREGMRRHLIAWRDRTFEVAKRNVRVNGVEADEASGEEEMEPFDELLNHQVYALEEERMAWEKTIGEYRRNGPSDVRTLMEGMLNHERGIEYRHSASAGSPTDDLGLDLQPVLSNLAEISATHARAIEQNRRVLQAAPSISERATRAQRVVDEVAQL